MNEEIKRLLELAAKAAGYKVVGDRHSGDGLNVLVGGRVWVWRPHADDGDSRRLEVQLRINVQFGCHEECSVNAYRYDADCDVEEFGGNDANKNTRLAVLRAAAAIGEAMP